MNNFSLHRGSNLEAIKAVSLYKMAGKYGRIPFYLLIGSSMGCHLQSFNLMIIKNKLRSNKSNGHSHVQAGERERERERERG